MRHRILPPLPLEQWADGRVVVVVAHPDDEVLGCGALLATLNEVRVVHVTDGAPRGGLDAQRHGFGSPTDYAVARHREALAALALAGVAADRLDPLGYADQTAADHLAPITRALMPIIERADVVLTHAFEGGHSDHDAVAFAVAEACRHLASAAPALYEMPFYFGEADGWVRQRFLPDGETVIVRVLSPAEQSLKARMLGAHATQRETLAAFSLDAERFRRARPRDFTLRPHGGPLLYERHGWNLTWDRWVAHVAAARNSLGRGTP